jgi:DNA-binding CsgD family transcriptional regulator
MTGDATIGGELTPREREVLAMVAAGLTNREIGEALFISESTAGVHVSHLMAKLGVGSRTEAAAWAYRAGLVEAAPGMAAADRSFADSDLGPPPEPPPGWIGRFRLALRDQLHRHPGGLAAIGIGGIAVLTVISVALAIAVLDGKEPLVGDLSSASPGPSAIASVLSTLLPRTSATSAPSVVPSSEEIQTTPTPLPLPSGTWSVAGTMSVTRSDQTATLLRDGTVLVAGGSELPTGETQASAELYHPDSGEWTTTGEMAQDRMAHSATLLDDGTVLVVGGNSVHPLQGGPSLPLASAELFDPQTGSWRATAPMTTARAWHSATLLDDGTVLVAGGSGADNTGLASAEVYDPQTATWTTVGPMADGRLSHTATRLNDGTVLVAGGSLSGSGASVAVAALYDPGSRTWSAVGRMGVGRYSHTATLLLDGTVLVAGGLSDLGPQASAEVYQPSTRSWAPAAGMAEARGYFPTATMLRDGTVLVVGGAYPTFTSTERYDPDSGQWSLTGALPQGRSRHTATLLANGDVLVSGGAVLSPGQQPVALLYHPDGGS